MTRVKTAAFKLHMGKYLRAVRAGEEVVILDRDQPVARVLAWQNSDNAESLSIEEPARNASSPGAVPLAPVRANGPIMELLLQERSAR